MKFQTFFETYGLKIGLIVILLLLGEVLLHRLVNRILKIAAAGRQVPQNSPRAKTLAVVMITTGNVAIYFVIIVMLLSLFSVDIGPILAGAGIIGLAVGFGAQTLVKDFIAGMFILLENQYTIGEQIKISDLEGEVIKVNMRSTILKDNRGRIIFISNSNIKEVINLSRHEISNKSIT